MTSYCQLQSQLAQLSSIFGRQMIGVHNRTNGFLVDVLESMLSRHLRFNTPVSTALHSQLRDSLLDTSVRKVIVLGHGAGAAILSSVLDDLHADLPTDILSKLEIYTFGSAASHLSNPCSSLDSPMNQNGSFTRADGTIVSPVKATLASRGYRTEDTERVIPHIEHYALSSDITARAGIIHNTCSALDNRFCGRLFILNKQPGFLFNAHYLSSLFPSSPSPHPVLDCPVEVDVETAAKREFTAQGVSVALKSLSTRQSSGSNTNVSPDQSPKSLHSHSIPMALPHSNSHVIGQTNGMKEGKRGSWSQQGIHNTSAVTPSAASVAQARNSAREAEGKTVRQLSRLWRYANGGKPVGEGVSVVNGVGLNLNGLGVGQSVGGGPAGFHGV